MHPFTAVVVILVALGLFVGMVVHQQVPARGADALVPASSCVDWQSAGAATKQDYLASGDPSRITIEMMDQACEFADSEEMLTDVEFAIAPQP